MADAQNRRKIRIGRVKDAIVFPFANVGSLVKLALFPIIIAAIASYAVLRAFWPTDIVVTMQEDVPRFMQAISPAINIIYLLALAVSAIVAVGIHRFIIRDEQPGWVIARFRWYELAYLLAPLVFGIMQLGLMIVVALAVLAAAAIIDPSLVGTLLGDPSAIQNLEGQQVPAGLAVVFAIGFFVLFVLIAWIGVRLTLMLPHAAVTGSLSPATSWRAMKGNFWRFFLTALLFGLGAILPAVLLTSLLMFAVSSAALGSDVGNTGTFPPGFIAVWAIPTLVYVLVFSMAVALLSYTYKDLVGDPAPTATA